MGKKLTIFAIATGLFTFSSVAFASEKVLPSRAELSSITKACLLAVTGTVDTLDLTEFGYKVTRANSKKLDYKRRNKVVSFNTPFVSTLEYSRSLEGRSGFTWLCQLEGFYGMDVKDAQEIIVSELKAAGYTQDSAPRRGNSTKWVKGQRAIKVDVFFKQSSGDFAKLTMSTR